MLFVDVTQTKTSAEKRAYNIKRYKKESVHSVKIKHFGLTKCLPRHATSKIHAKLSNGHFQHTLHTNIP